MKSLAFSHARPRGLWIALAAAILPAQAAQAQPQAPSSWGGIFTSVFLTSDYRYQGVSSSNANPATQLSVYWWRPDNFYAGAFTSEVDFDDPGHTSYEVDLYAGRHLDLNQKKTRVTAEAMFTAFPDEHVYGPTYNFVQLKLAARHTQDRLTLGAVTSYVPQASYGSGVAWRVEGEAAYALTPNLTLNAGIGRRWIERGQDRSYWNLGATAKWKTLSLGVRYEDTDLSRAECGYRDWCAPAIVGTLMVDLPPLMFGQRE